MRMVYYKLCRRSAPGFGRVGRHFVETHGGVGNIELEEPSVGQLVATTGLVAAELVEVGSCLAEAVVALGLDIAFSRPVDRGMRMWELYRQSRRLLGRVRTGCTAAAASCWSHLVVEDMQNCG